MSSIYPALAVIFLSMAMPAIAQPNDIQPASIHPGSAASEAQPDCAAVPGEEIILPGTGIALALPQEDVPEPCAEAPPKPRPPAPHIFGSIALPVSITSLDAQWNRVRAANSVMTDGPWGSLILRLREMDHVEKIRTVNNWVNARIAFRNDDQGDEWMTAAQTLARGAGDCEDFAIAKMQLLERAGFDPSELYLVIVRDQTRQEDHAVLAVRHEDRLTILDSRSNHLLNDVQVTDYKPIFTYSGEHAWTHGYRRAARLP